MLLVEYTGAEMGRSKSSVEKVDGVEAIRYI